MNLSQPVGRRYYDTCPRLWGGNVDPCLALRHLGERIVTGIGQVVVLGPDQGTRFRLGADRFVTKGDPSQRSEGFSVIEYEGAPGVEGPPLHRHRTFEEAWYILDGEVTVMSAGEVVEATRGAYLLVPRGIPHTFRVAGSRPARWVGIFSPGRYVGLLEELGGAMPSDGPSDLEAVARLFAKYDTELA